MILIRLKYYTCSQLKSATRGIRPSLIKIRKLTTHSALQGGASHAFRKTTAGAFGPDLAKKLSQLVKMEKNVMRSMELVGRERMEVAVSLPPFKPQEYY